MQIEKINNNKLKVILNSNDLEENHIDFNSFMANSLESQELFLDILDLAEEEFNFYVDNSKLVIESISLANNIFIFTITKLNNTQSDTVSSNFIYRFHKFDELHYVCSILKGNKPFHIYTYYHQFYLIVDKNCIYNDIINEFCNEKSCSSSLENILTEHGKKIY